MLPRFLNRRAKLKTVARNSAKDVGKWMETISKVRMWEGSTIVEQDHLLLELYFEVCKYLHEANKNVYFNLIRISKWKDLDIRKPGWADHVRKNRRQEFRDIIYSRENYRSAETRHKVMKEISIANNRRHFKQLKKKPLKKRKWKSIAEMYGIEKKLKAIQKDGNGAQISE